MQNNIHFFFILFCSGAGVFQHDIQNADLASLVIPHQQQHNKLSCTRTNELDHHHHHLKLGYILKGLNTSKHMACTLLLLIFQNYQHYRHIHTPHLSLSQSPCVCNSSWNLKIKSAYCILIIFQIKNGWTQNWLTDWLPASLSPHLPAVHILPSTFKDLQCKIPPLPPSPSLDWKGMRAIVLSSERIHYYFFFYFLTRGSHIRVDVA